MNSRALRSLVRARTSTELETYRERLKVVEDFIKTFENTIKEELFDKLHNEVEELRLEWQ